MAIHYSRIHKNVTTQLEEDFETNISQSFSQSLESLAYFDNNGISKSNIKILISKINKAVEHNKIKYALIILFALINL